MKIPTRMPSGGCDFENPDTLCLLGILGICILGVAIVSEKSRHVCLLGVAFWVFAFWGLRFVKIPTRMPSGGCILGICILGVAIRENPDTYAFWGSHFGGYLKIPILGVAIRLKIPTRMPSGGRILGICILGVAIRENPDTYAFWGSHFGYLHSGGCDS